MKPKRNKIHLGDTVAWLKSLDDDCVDMVVGSPPYPRKALRYGTDQRKMTNEQWLDWMVAICQELVRVSRGYCFLVINNTVKNGFYEPMVEGLMWKLWGLGVHLDRPDIWTANKAPNRNGRYLSNTWEFVVALKPEPYPLFNWEALATDPKYKTGGHFRQRSNNGGERKKGSAYPTGPAKPRDVFRVIVGGGHTGFDSVDDKLANSGKAPFPSVSLIASSPWPRHRVAWSWTHGWARGPRPCPPSV